MDNIIKKDQLYQTVLSKIKILKKRISILETLNPKFKVDTSTYCEIGKKYLKELRRKKIITIDKSTYSVDRNSAVYTCDIDMVLVHKEHNKLNKRLSRLLRIKEYYEIGKPLSRNDLMFFNKMK